MQDKTLQKLRSILRYLANNQEYITRSELAYNLQDCGVEHDSNQLAEWVFSLIRDKDKAVRMGAERILTNDRTQTLIEQWTRYEYADAGEFDNLQQQTNKHLKVAEKALEQLAQTIKKGVLVEGNDGKLSKVINTITGTAGIARIKQEGEATMKHYANTIEAYQKARMSVEYSVEDFVVFRELLLETYQKYSQALEDVFGEQIRAEVPELFDFTQIEYLDPNQMFEQLHLEFTKLSEKCGVLLGELGLQFVSTLQKGVKQAQGIEDKRVQVAMLAFNVLGHYVDVAGKTQALRAELSTLQTLSVKDLSQIRGDIERLRLIYDTLEKLLIPKVDVFHRFAQIILSDELEQVIARIYASPEVNRLQAQREQRQKRLKVLQRQLVDCNRNINRLAPQIQDTQALLEGLSDRCTEAQEALPKAPSIIKIAYTFGAAKRRYNKASADWKLRCYPFIVEYEALKSDLLSDQEELEEQKKLKDELSLQIQHLEKELRQHSEQIKQSIVVDKELRQALFPHINHLVALLRSAKELLTAKIDKKYLKALQLEALPQHNSKQMSDAQIMQYILEQNKQDINISERMAETSVLYIGQELGFDTVEPLRAEELTQLAEVQTDLLKQGLSLAGQMLQLQEQWRNDQLTQEHYTQQLTELQRRFRGEIANIDAEAIALKQIVTQIKNANNRTELQSALLLLAGRGNVALTEAEWEAFLEGNKEIII